MYEIDLEELFEQLPTQDDILRVMQQIGSVYKLLSAIPNDKFHCNDIIKYTDELEDLLNKLKSIQEQRPDFVNIVDCRVYAGMYEFIAMCRRNCIYLLTDTRNPKDIVMRVSKSMVSPFTENQVADMSMLEIIKYLYKHHHIVVCDDYLSYNDDEYDAFIFHEYLCISNERLTTIIRNCYYHHKPSSRFILDELDHDGAVKTYTAKSGRIYRTEHVGAGSRPDLRRRRWIEIYLYKLGA